MRIVSSIVLIALAFVTVRAGGVILAAWVGLAGVLMAYEWHRIAYQRGYSVILLLHLAALGIVISLSSLDLYREALWVIVLATIGAGSAALLVGMRPYWAVVGLPYTVLPCAAFLWLRGQAALPVETALWLLALVCSSDILAYVCGRTFGGPKLAPQISPAKTWTGLGGAIGGAVLVGLVAGHLAGSESLWPLAALSGLLAVVSQTGDLTESAFKRRFGVKDSSRLIPGQGGVLDRLDGLIFVTLAVTALALLNGGRVPFLGAAP